MDPRGQPRPDSARNSHRTKDREDYYRYSQQDGNQGHPPQDPRERDRNWAHSDAHYRSHYSSPPARPEQHPYNSQQYQYGYGHLEHQRPQSSYDQGRKTSQHYFKDYEDNPSRDQEDVSPYYLGTLESSKTSGMSSSSYELSQYINGAEHSEPYFLTTPVPSISSAHQMSAPLKFPIPHAVVSFGPAGQLIRVSPGLSTRENVSQLEIHSVEVILGDTNEQQEMRNFPGPLTREDLHKVDAMEFAHQRADACMKDDKLPDKKSAGLLWNLLILLCRQNGKIVGSDIAELLMQGSHADGSWEAEPPTLIDFSDSSKAEEPPQRGDDLLTGNLSSFSSETSEKDLQSYTQLLLAGRKKEALESAMNSGMWGHALFLASKMDNRSYTTVLSRFTGQLTASDPLQTLFQLLSGRIPAVAMCCGNEKWGDWRPHLAVMLSNETGDAAVQQKAIVTMGDTLASKDLVYASHICYLTASVPFGLFTQKAERLVLLGSSHRFLYFSTFLEVKKNMFGGIVPLIFFYF
uniref:Protein transport protein sec16 n=1 Tax=Labrus bergylta TaxID=56723 RepID=A0A3Q3E1W9_9LABR